MRPHRVTRWFYRGGDSRCPASRCRGAEKVGRPPRDTSCSELRAAAGCVEDLDELVEPSLLLQKIGSRRLGGFSLQGQMHALMAAGLLRMTRLDPFNANTEPEPPDRKFAQVKQGMGGSEGHAVVAADVGRQAALLKKPLKHSESIVFPGRRKGFTGEQKPAGVVGDGQRIAVMMTPQQKLAFVIGAPQLIGALA